MACPFLRMEGASCRCGAVEAEVIPSLHEREHFCLQAWQFVRCDWYRWSRSVGRTLTEQEYLAGVFGESTRT